MTDPSLAAPVPPGGPAASINDVMEVILHQYTILVRESAIKQVAWQDQMLMNAELRNQISVRDQQIAALQQQISMIEAASETSEPSSNGQVIEGEVSDASTGSASN